MWTLSPTLAASRASNFYHVDVRLSSKAKVEPKAHVQQVITPDSVLLYEFSTTIFPPDAGVHFSSEKSSSTRSSEEDRPAGDGELR